MHTFSRRLGLAVILVLGGTAWAAAQQGPTITKNIEYATRDSGALLADLFVPQGEGPFPGVLVVHGGAWRSGNKDQLTFVANRLSRSGYTVMAINYRLCPEHKFPTQIEDCKSAVRWMRRNASQMKLDPSWIAGWGYSAGAHLVSLLGTTDSSAGFEGPDAGTDGCSSRLQAVVAGGTPCDFRPLPAEDEMLVDFLGATAGQDPKAYERVSPIVYVTKDDAPLFLYHGDADELVPLENAMAMEKACQEAGMEVELLILPKAKHIGAAIDMRGLTGGMKFLDAHRPAKKVAAGVSGK